MDLPIWDWSDSQDYLTSYANESGCYTEDHLLRDFALDHGRDMLEEDALNEISCMQVLKIWIDKADDDILKLEEDILILKCQLIWDDEDWSKQCSAVLREKIDCLDILIQSAKDDTESDLQVETEELPPRLHDLLKPLLENYLAKSEQTETSIVQIPLPAAVGLGNNNSKASNSKDFKKREGNVCTNVLKTYERKSKSTELEEREIHHPQEKKHKVTIKFKASAPTCRNDAVSENSMSKPSTKRGRRMLNLAHAESERHPRKAEPAAPVVNESTIEKAISVKESSASMSIDKANSRENEEKRNIDNKTTSKVNVIPGRLQCQSKVTLTHLKLQERGSQISETVKVVDAMKPKTEASSRVCKESVYSRTKKGYVLSVKPSVKMKGKNTNFPEPPESVGAQETEMKNPPCSISDRKEHVKKPRMEHQILVQQRQKIEGQCNKNHAAEPSEVPATPIPLPQEVRILSLGQQTTSQEGLTSSQVKLEEMDYGNSNSTAQEAADDVKTVPQISSIRIKDQANLTCKQLRAIAKSKSMRGYYKLKKEELQTRLGLL